MTRAGSVADSPGKEGVANLTASTIKLGTKTREALEIENALGDLGTSIRTSAARDTSQVSLLKSNLAPAFSIFADVARNPIFPEDEVAREKKLQLDRLGQEAKNANALAARIQDMLLFGPDHPYGRPRTGLPGTIGPLTREDLSRFHETYWKPGGSALIFAGDITLSEAAELAQKQFGSWSGGAPPTLKIPAAQPMDAGKVFVVDRQDAAQTVVAQLLTAPLRNADDYYAFNLADAVYGGGFQTRLNLNLRENKGYSYSVFSFPAFYARGSGWVASGGVQTNKTKESIVEFVSELKNIAGEKPITETELENAKANRVRGYAQQFETLSQLVQQISQLWTLGLPMTELQRYPDETRRATLANVNAAAQKYAVPGKTALLLVGDYSKIGPGLRELNLGEIIILDAEGKPVRR